MAPQTASRSEREARDAVVIRFAGDSGDGMQLTGLQFMRETALAGGDLATFPDYPAEIRAPSPPALGVIHCDPARSFEDEVLDRSPARAAKALNINELLRMGRT